MAKSIICSLRVILSYTPMVRLFPVFVLSSILISIASGLIASSICAAAPDTPTIPQTGDECALSLLTRTRPNLRIARVAPQQQPADPPVGQVRKNIQVLTALKEIPDSQLFMIMNYVTDSLGVSCDYCHVKEKNPKTGAEKWLWERDDRRPKLVARDMMRMVLELNQNTFKHEAAVTCYTCHRGSTQPEHMTPLPPRDFLKDSQQSSPTGEKVMPTPSEIFAKYVSAVGAEHSGNLSRVFVMKGTVDGPSGSGTVEIVFKQPNKCLIKQTTASQGMVTRGTNGSAAWAQTPNGIIQITGERLKRSVAAVAAFNPIKIPDSASKATVAGISKVEDKAVYVLTIEDNSTQSTQLFFDTQTGFLLRTVTITSTILGPLNAQWDFSDYRDVSGTKMPFSIRYSDVAPFDTTIRRFNEIRIDNTINDGIFDMPRGSSP